jgi:hypothetical protein
MARKQNGAAGADFAAAFRIERATMLKDIVDTFPDEVVALAERIR